MRIVVPTIGSRGDVQPFIALAQGLTRARQIVTLASHPVMGPRVLSHGVASVPIGPNLDFAREVAAIRQSSRGSLAWLVRAMCLSFEVLERSRDDILGLWPTSSTGQESCTSWAPARN